MSTTHKRVAVRAPEAAERLGISLRELYRRADAGKLEACEVDGKLAVYLDDADQA